MKQLWAPWRMVYVGGDEKPAGDCFLCAAANEDGQATASVVERAERTFTMLNRFPYSSGHLLIVPRRHVPDILGLSEEEGGALFSATQRALLALGVAMSPDGYNVGVNHGEAAGASIEHVHLHVVPRWSGDTNFMPVLADTKVLPEHLEATAEKLRAAFSRL